MITLTSEFDFNEEVYILKDSSIIKTRIRYVKFPDASRFDVTPDDRTIQYGCCTEKILDDLWGDQENNSWYDWRFACQIGRTKNELLDKLRD